MADVIALANNDVVEIVWHYVQIPGCLGFEVSRQQDGASPAGSWTPLPAWVGFQGEQNPNWTARTTSEWPIQKYGWKDLVATPGASYGYRIAPMLGEPGNLKPQVDQALYSNVVTLTPTRGSFSTYFNRGILSTQFVAHQLPPGPSGTPDYRTLDNRIDQPGDPLRNALAGQIITGLESLLDRVDKEGGECYAALYELDDPELVQRLLQVPAGKVHLILSNTGANDATNKSARQALHDNGTDITDRMLPSGHIGHNKFIAYVGADGTPQAVLLGSTNWTDTALCAQSNNALIVESPPLAQAYCTYWNRLKDDVRQASPLRQADATAGADAPIDNAKATVWFSPNTPHARQRSRNGGNVQEATPPDLDVVFSLMQKAQKAILFLVFQPGHPSIVEQAAEIGNARPDLFIRGAATDPKAVGSFDTILVHRAGQDPDSLDVVAAMGVNDQFSFWVKELDKAGPTAHAIVHSKIVVIDPMTPDCIVVTGSHNLGYEASYNNDENLIIVRGHQDLAHAYAVNVLDVYDHYRFRFQLAQKGSSAFSALNTTDAWQAKYFDPTNPASQDAKAWFD